MTNRTAANRYARALFDVVVKEGGDPAVIGEQLDSFADLFKKHPALEKVLLNPAVPAARKRAATSELTSRAKLSPILAKLLLLLAERDRLILLPELADTYRSRVLENQKVVRAEVTTATPLSPERAKAIERSLARVTGRTVTLTTKVEPELIGGLVARVGSTVYDGSVTRQLNKMRQRLVEGA